MSAVPCGFTSNACQLLPRMPKLLNSALAALVLGALHALSFFNEVLPAAVIPLVQWGTFSLFTVIVFKSKTCKPLLLKSTLFGTASFNISLYWLYISMHKYGNMPGVLAGVVVVLFAFYLSFFLTAASALFLYLRSKALNDYSRRAHLILPLLWAALVTLGELARGYLFTGFPWNNIAYAYVDTIFSSWAPVGGAYLVCFVVAFCCGLTALFIDSSDKTKEFGILATLIALFALSWVVQTISWSEHHGSRLRVRLVQGNIDQLRKFDSASALESVQEQIRLAESPLPKGTSTPQAIIFPETIMPTFQDRMPVPVWQDLIQISHNTGAKLYVGTPIYSKTANTPAQITNSLIEIDSETAIPDIYNGNNLEVYNKRHLVPFGEFVPWGFRWFVDAMDIPLGDMNRGLDNQGNFEVADQVLAPNICYEDIFGEELIGSLFPKTNNSPGATIMFNVSNLGWFGDTIALTQQLQQSRMRTLETARPMVRATNTGVTAVINDKGLIISRLPTGVPGVLDTSVQGTTGYTLYGRTGNITILMLCLVIVIQFWLLTANPFFRVTPLPPQPHRKETEDSEDTADADQDPNNSESKR